MPQNPKTQCYKKATYRNTLPYQDNGSVPIGFESAGSEPILLLLSLKDAVKLSTSIHESVVDYWFTKSQSAQQ